VKRALVVLASLLAACRSPQYAGWTPNDQRPGWKQAALPADAPALAGPPGIDQYRTNERALAWREEGTVPASHNYSAGGSVDFHLELDGAPADAVEATFAARLGGAAVEASALTAGGIYVSLPRTRVHTTTVRLQLADPLTSAVILTVHHHLRAQPQLVAWRAGAWSTPPGGAALLVYEQPPGQSILLCNRPEQTMEFHPVWWPIESPRRVSLERTLVSRAWRWVWR
jgi:hypothetical protein